MNVEKYFVGKNVDVWYQFMYSYINLDNTL